MIILTLQWVGGIALGLVALAAVICFGAAVLTIPEQPTMTLKIVQGIIASVLAVIIIASALGCWALVTKALGW